MELPCLDCKRLTVANNKSKIFIGAGGRFYLACHKCTNYRKIVKLVDEENNLYAESFYEKNKIN